MLVTGGATMQDLSGPVGIVSAITEVGNDAPSAGVAWFRIFYFAALVAVNLAVMNLLPIPALDGGRDLLLAGGRGVPCGCSSGRSQSGIRRQ